MNMRYWGTVIFATLFSWHNSRWRKATGARNPDGSCTTSSVWQQLVLPGETKNCSHAAMPVVICCGTTGRETWTRKCLQCFDVLSILSLTLLLSNVTGSRARGWNFRFAGSQAISFQDFGFSCRNLPCWTRRRSLLGELLPWHVRRSHGEPAAATQVQCIGGIGLLGEASQGKGPRREVQGQVWPWRD